jgi:hypothetical protein
MNNIVILGNSHAAVLANNWNHGSDVLGFKEVRENLYVSWMIPWGCWGINNDFLDRAMGPTKHLIDRETLVLFYLGSADIRNNLAIHKNTEQVVSEYVDMVTEYFSSFSCSVGFIDPVPICIDDIFWNNPNYVSSFGGRGSIKEQLKQHAIFKEVLRKKSKLCISLDDIVSDSGIRRDESDDGCHLNMSKNEQLINKIVNLFIRKHSL